MNTSNKLNHCQLWSKLMLIMLMSILKTEELRKIAKNIASARV